MKLEEHKSAFALDNDGFRYALATAQGADLKTFAKEAEDSWKRSSAAALKIMREIKNMKPFTTISIASLNESYLAVSKMCYVSLDSHLSIDNSV